MGNLIRKALRERKAGRSWQLMVDYTPDQLRAHIERQFTDGMTWPRFLAGEIHIDHIVPLASFEFATPDDPSFRFAWSLANLRPLWARENLEKRAKRLFLV